MSKSTVTHDSFTLERSYDATPARLFAAWADPAQKRRWFAEGEPWTVQSFQADFREGGHERTVFHQKDGSVITNETVYHDIIDGQRIVSSYSMTLGGKRFSTSLATVEISASGKGSTLRFTEQAAFFEGGDGVAMRKQGWTELFDRLGKLLAG